MLSNAVKYSPPGSEVRTILELDSSVARVTFADKGPGMLPEEQQERFRPFTRLARDRGIRGSGLGLYIADMIARAHGGQITVKSAPGKGSRFTVTLPRRSAL